MRVILRVIFRALSVLTDCPCLQPVWTYTNFLCSDIQKPVLIGQKHLFFRKIISELYIWKIFSLPCTKFSRSLDIHSIFFCIWKMCE